MESRLKLFGHPMHPMLIVFPLGLLATSVIFDIVHLITGSGNGRRPRSSTSGPASSADC
jgi:uncharacterized membrane protein